ncbi:methyl-CpG-binding domain-containing protein [Stylosanthes scabra]|uniref:Methyl-CpG-binding domain-containing protein n=1 Tax=Stylosanthes scabra TaxID=79078 RepID=A0ABU6TAP8_9FABA|nr:methyl-CpG-binding domain-containing protein [Stylosanthes scabra]
MHRGKFSLTPKNEVKGLSGSGLTSYKHSNPSDPIELSSSDDENDISNNDMSKQLVLYDPTANGRSTLDLFPGPIQCTPPLPPRSKPPSSTPRILPSPPAGWERLLRIRAEGSTKFADVYYVAPNGKRLRSMVEVQKFLLEHPEYIRDGVTLSQFSFQIPKPLQENYVRKRPLKLKSSYEDGRPIEPEQVSPLAWAAPEDPPKMHEERPVPFAAGSDDDYPLSPPTKKQATDSSLQKDVPNVNEDLKLGS